MAEINDATLQIEVKANTSEANKQFEALQKTLNGITASIEKMTNSIQSLTSSFVNVAQDINSVMNSLNSNKGGKSSSPLGGSKTISDNKKILKQLEQYKGFIEATVEDARRYDVETLGIGSANGDVKKIEEIYKKFNEKREEAVNPLTGEVINMNAGYAAELRDLTAVYDDLTAKINEMASQSAQSANEEYLSVQKRISIWKEYQKQITIATAKQYEMILKGKFNPKEFDAYSEKIKKLKQEQEEVSGFELRQNRDAKGIFASGKSMFFDPQHFQEDAAIDILGNQNLEAVKTAWSKEMKDVLYRLSNLRKLYSDDNVSIKELEAEKEYLLKNNPYVGEKDSNPLKQNFNKQYKQRNSANDLFDKNQKNLMNARTKYWDTFNPLSKSFGDTEKRDKYKEELDYFKQYGEFLKNQGKVGKGRAAFFSLGNMARRLVLYKLINVAIQACVKALRLAFDESKKIFELYKSANSNNLLTSQYEQLTYLTNQLGMNYEQLYQMMETNTGTILEMLERYRDLGGLISDEELKNATSLSNKMSDLSAAWEGFKYTWQNTFYGLNSLLVDGLTAVVDMMNGTDTNIAEVSEETVLQLKEALYTTGLIKRQMMGFDELNILSPDTLTALENYERAAGQITTDVEQEQTGSYIGGSSAEEYQAAQETLTQENEQLKQTLNETEHGTSEWFYNIGERWDNFIQKIKNAVLRAKDWCQEVASTLLAPANFLTTWVTAFISSIKGVVNVITDVGRVIWGVFESLFGLIDGFFNKDWSTSLDGLKNIGRGIANFFIDIFNYIIDAFRDIVKGIGNIGITLPKWLGGYSWHLNDGGWFTGEQIKNIPRYAKGGVITTPTVGLMGEYTNAKSNPEIVTPTSLLKETIDESNGELASVMAQCTRQLLQAIEQKNMSVSIGDKDIAEATNRYNNSYRKMTGKALLTI